MSILSNIMRAILAPFTEEVFLQLIEIDHASLVEPYRFVANTEDVEHNGETYTAFGFVTQPPAPDSNQHSLTLDNAQRTLLPFLQSIAASEPATVKLIRIAYSEPDEVIESYEFELRQIQANALVITAALLADVIENEGAPADDSNPRDNAGLFGEGE